MLRGLTTHNFFAADVTAAVAWYTELLGVQPYFERELDGKPAYVEFRIGDYQHELGILDRRFAPPGAGAAGGTVTYWAVDDIEAAYQRLLDLGGTPQQGPTEHGPGFVTASVIDPFGNILGVMFNQHYLNVLAGQAGE
ncbi:MULTISPECIES: VOC family protein [unclassified Crossiella]|uniref:VOC family protein n=1 Tax=unclassified Crossiella TaxID=2620835 RepID=UPI001FFF2DE0|nr:MULTISPECIES: VOC family protein [unclassified Crossiella]MCK2239138.1 VOC family protein [Crossiella sp. S99.2]MCK2251293.1 VOC family protein [Crossiella sp. S99.1]